MLVDVLNVSFKLKLDILTCDNFSSSAVYILFCLTFMPVFVDKS